MTAYETKARIEAELEEIKKSFGEAEHLVQCDVQMGENEIEGDTTDITYIFGSLSLGTPDMTDDERLYLPLDAELDDDDNVNDEEFEKSLASFKERVYDARDYILSTNDYEAAVKNLIKTFDEEINRKLLEERLSMEMAAKKRLIIAAIAAGAAAIVAIAILVIQQVM